MSLRARLIAAFFLLAVVPLAGVTVHSYLTTERAYRAAVEAEAAAMTEEMNGRLASATRDLGNRLERLADLPFGALASGTADAASKQKLLADLQAQMGDAAPLLQSLEFVPVPPSPQEPAPAPVGTAPAHPGPLPAPAATQTIVIAGEPPPPRAAGAAEAPGLAHWVFKFKATDVASHEVGQHLEAQARKVEVERGAEREAPGAERAQGLEQAQQQRQHALQEVAEERQRLEARGAEMAEHALQAAALALSRNADDKQRAVQLWTDTTRSAIRVAGSALRLWQRSGDSYGYTLRRDGAELGTVRAQIRSQELLATILSGTRRRQGEVPFAIDGEGKLYAADEDRPGLERLVVTQDRPAQRRAKASGDWVVVKRRDDQSGLTLGIARPVGDGLKEIRKAAATNLGYGLGITSLAIVGILPLSRRITRDLGTLTEAAQRLAQGDLDARVPVRSRDEFGRLAETFNRMAADLRSHQDQLLGQERLRKELEMGRRIQEEMLPHERLSVPFAEAMGISIPAREVGGDLFNYFLLPDGRAALVVGDVSGKGVGAALLMANLQATLRARLPVEADLCSLADHLDREIDRSTPMTVYLTAFIAVLDGARRMRYVNAGHNFPFVLRADGRVEALESTGRPLGLLPGGSYEEGVVQFGDGDSLFLYTDGVVESENEAGEPFGVDRLKQLLVAERASGVDGILERVEREVREYRGSHEAEDDATLVVLKVAPGGSFTA
jgi:serine phosphatase RsbU (regulator of sigma subunit)